jgi:hypothetical protein
MDPGKSGNTTTNPTPMQKSSWQRYWTDNMGIPCFEYEPILVGPTDEETKVFDISVPYSEFWMTPDQLGGRALTSCVHRSKNGKINYLFYADGVFIKKEVYALNMMSLDSFGKIACKWELRLEEYPGQGSTVLTVFHG